MQPGKIISGNISKEPFQLDSHLPILQLQDRHVKGEPEDQLQIRSLDLSWKHYFKVESEAITSGQNCEEMLPLKTEMLAIRCIASLDRRSKIGKC